MGIKLRQIIMDCNAGKFRPALVVKCLAILASIGFSLAAEAGTSFAQTRLSERMEKGETMLEKLRSALEKDLSDADFNARLNDLRGLVSAFANDLIDAEETTAASENKANSNLRSYGTAGEVALKASEIEKEISAVLGQVDPDCVDRWTRGEIGSACERMVEQMSSISLDLPSLETCSSINVEFAGRSTVLLGGVVGSKDVKDRLSANFGRQAVADVAVKSWPVCFVYGSLSSEFGRDNAPIVDLLSGKTVLSYEDSLAFKVQMPDCDCYLYVLYLQSDGSLVRLHPMDGDDRGRRKFSSGERILFGDGEDGRLRFTASPPAGVEAIIAVASTQKINFLDNFAASGGNQGTSQSTLTEFFGMLKAELDRKYKVSRPGNDASNPFSISAGIVDIFVSD